MKHIKTNLLLCICLGLTACAHTPTRGDQMLGASQSSNQLSRDWNNGDKQTEEGRNLIVKGKKNIAQGNELNNESKDKISSGNKMIESGNEKISQGEKAKLESEEVFNANFPQHNKSVGS